MERAGAGEIQFYIKRIEEVVNPETQETEEVATVIATSNKISYIVKEALGEGNIAGGITQEQVSQIEQYIAGFQTKANITDVYTKTQTDNLLADKIDYISLPFVPVHVYRDKYVAGRDIVTNDPVFRDLEGAIAVIIPAKAKKGILSWDANDNLLGQVMSLDANFKWKSNAGINISEGRATLNLSEHVNFKATDYKYLCFATSNINTVEYNGIFSSDSLYIDAYTKEATDTLLEKKMDDFPLPFMPVRVYKDKYCAGWVSWGDNYGDPRFLELEGSTGFILPVRGHVGLMTWKVNSETSNPNQIVALDANLKRVANSTLVITDSIASFNFKYYFKNVDFDYVAFATTDVSSITLKEILSSDGFYIEDHEVFNDKLVSANFLPPYCYSLETDLYFYPQALFNKPLNIVYNNGSNSIVQAIVKDGAYHNLSLPNIVSPTGTQVTLAGGKKVLFIGDSYTAHGIYIKYVYDTMNSLGKAPTLLGTQSSTIDGVQYRHEGHSGWRAFTYACCEIESEDIALSGNTPNPFWNDNLEDPPIFKENKPIKFDFSYYMANYHANYSNDDPDIVFINLGTNDLSPTRGDYNTESDIVTLLKAMVDSIKKYDSNISVIGWLPVQLPIGVNSGYNRWEGVSKYSQILINNQKKSDTASDKIGFTDLCPVRYAFDCYSDGRYVTQNINGHDMILLSDTTHPSELGYQHIGQMIIPYIHNY